ncbi:phosphoribosylformylglycinamidine cyclo-ligase [bacterium]|mgnify:FL=1|nr:phosphoribosylformylglycinamidine cyclo-ligase [bacterium]|tara:strand:- start:3695 stop:4708 length:1014 start_codon:yes stop_codon:yes gene_type:complete
MKPKITYKDSGVNIKAGNDFVSKIQPYVRKTLNRNVLGNTTSFAAAYSIDQEKIKNPVLVSCTDGVGTKIEVGIKTNKIKGLGIDLVAMSVNDLICTGAKPLFFLDYLATSKLNLNYHSEIIKGIVDGCRLSSCSLVGGETAEMPGMYKGKDFDLAGFAVGIVDRKKIIDPKKIKGNEILVGISSSGPHSNGYSLIRKLFFNRNIRNLNNSALINSVMKPTKIYVDLISSIQKKISIKGMAHITGGGLIENIPRFLPKGMGVELIEKKLPKVKLFKEIQAKSGLDFNEMIRIFNMGIGFVICINSKDLERLEKILKLKKEKAYLIGRVIKKSEFRII